MRYEVLRQHRTAERTPFLSVRASAIALGLKAARPSNACIKFSRPQIGGIGCKNFFNPLNLTAELFKNGSRIIDSRNDIRIGTRVTQCRANRYPQPRNIRV